MDRRNFIKLTTGSAALSAWGLSCKTSKQIPGKIISATADRGHLLRDQTFGEPAGKIKKEVVIVGGGVSGLSAAWWLMQNGVKDCMLLDLEDKAGGNAVFGENTVSAFPWGAHYVPLPNNNLAEYLSFLESCKVITGRNEEGLPVYNEEFLCFDPEERLYIHGRWQEGLVPQFGVPDADKNEIHRFLALMEEYRYAKGSDGRDAFAIPVSQSTADPAYRLLSEQTMKEWMEAQPFRSRYLHQYVNYCCRDDFGTTHDRVSAWAGIHYFAGRKGKGSNASYQDVLTWPEGNGFLVKHLEKNCKEAIQTKCLVTKVIPGVQAVEVHYLDIHTGILHAVEARQCILAVPQFVAARLLQDKERIRYVQQHYSYAPWMVANIRVNALTERSGMSSCWDNVLFESASLGYVDATHQQLKQVKTQRNLTYYLPLTQMPPAEERKKAMQKTHQQWAEEIISELEIVHPDIRQQTEEINIRLWGHAMRQPLPGFLQQDQLAASINDQVHFAHTDLAGISIFEEAFYQGIAAARKIIQRIH